MKAFWSDILKTSDPEKRDSLHFSQSRLYLFISILFFYLFMIGNIFWGIGGDNFKFIIDSTFYAIVFFGSYALVKKGMSHGQQWKQFLEEYRKRKD